MLVDITGTYITKSAGYIEFFFYLAKYKQVVPANSGYTDGPVYKFNLQVKQINWRHKLKQLR